MRDDINDLEAILTRAAGPDLPPAAIKALVKQFQRLFGGSRIYIRKSDPPPAKAASIGRAIAAGSSNR